MQRRTLLPVGALLLTLIATPLVAQTPPNSSSLVGSIQQGASHVESVFTKAADQMSDEDYAFRPTPEVRSFGQLLAHVAATNYWFCASAMGEKPPVTGIDTSSTSKKEIQKALLASFAYCNRAYSAMTDESKANAMRSFRNKPHPAIVLLNFRNYHSLLHWGNAITYMRLRGRVPPAT